MKLVVSPNLRRRIDVDCEVFVMTPDVLVPTAASVSEKRMESVVVDGFRCDVPPSSVLGDLGPALLALLAAAITVMFSHAFHDWPFG